MRRRALRACCDALQAQWGLTQCTCADALATVTTSHEFASSAAAAAAGKRVPRIKFPPRVGPGGTRLSQVPATASSSSQHGAQHAQPQQSHTVAAVSESSKAAPPPQAPVQRQAEQREGTPPAPYSRPEPYGDTTASNIRKVIASRLIASKQGAPHAYVSRDVPLDAVSALRAQLAAKGSKHSVNDFVIRAAAVALMEAPSGAGLAPGAAADISIAVATPTGLMTPIVKAANTLSLAQVTATVKELAALARDGKLKPEQYQGGTFSVSNLGMFPVDNFAAILNPPQAAILAVGRAQEQVVMGEGGLSSSSIMNVTLSVDATRVDATAAAQWLDAFAQALVKPEQLL